LSSCGLCGRTIGKACTRSRPIRWSGSSIRRATGTRKRSSRKVFEKGLESGGALVTIDRKSGRIIGSSRYLEFVPEKREIEIGWTFLARSHWGGAYNGEMKRLMLDHAFRFVDTVVFVIGAQNFRSQKAVEKIGGVKLGPREIEYRGKTYEHVVYLINKRY
jgi:RimJ/RimL family protein N-acetyltransferase